MLSDTFVEKSRFIFYCLVAYFVFRLVSFWRRIGQPKKPEQPLSPRTSGSGLMVKDDICQTYLPRESALRAVKL